MKDVSAMIVEIETHHPCVVTYKDSETVREVVGDQVAWEGDVGIFSLMGHPKAERCYAWSYTDNNGEQRIHTALEVPPVDSPRSAVKAFIANRR